MNLTVQLRLMRVHVADHVPVHITTSTAAIQTQGVYLLHKRLHLFLEHAVELERLARGQAQGGIRTLVGNFIQAQPLVCGQHPTRQTQAHHKLVKRLQLLAPALISYFPVVLLVGAVELGQFGIILWQGAGGTVSQAFQNGSAKVVALALDYFGFRQFFSH